jgi:hypothetical protein
MPYHLELGSEGHSFGGKAIVVNSKTGEHHSAHPLGVHKAYGQLNALRAAERKEEGVKAEPALKMMKMKHEAQKEEIPEREEEGVKEVKAHLRLSVPQSRERAPEHDSARTLYICHLADWIYNNRSLIISEFTKQVGKDGKSYLFYIDDMLKKGLPGRKYLKGGISYKGEYMSISDEDVFAILFQEEKTASQASLWLRLFSDGVKRIIHASRGKVITEEMLGTTKGEEEEAKPEPKRDALAEFIQTAPEDITGVDYGTKNKEGKLQQGVITKMLGRESLDIAKNIIMSCQSGDKTQSYARLCGALRFIKNIAQGEMNDFSDVKAHNYERYGLDRMKEGPPNARGEPRPLTETEKDPVYRAFNMSVRILANHEKSINISYNKDSAKILTQGIVVGMLLPPSKTVALIDAQMPEYFSSNVGHTSGMGHARDNYKWSFAFNRQTKAGKEKYEARMAECKKIASGLLDSLLANLKEGAYLYLDKGHKAKEEEKATEKAKGAAAFEIPQGEKKAVTVFLTEDILSSIILAITGDPKKASAKVEEYRASGKLGRKALVYRSNRGNKRVNIEVVPE